MVEYTYTFYENETKIGEVTTDEALLDRDIDNAVSTIAGRGTPWTMGDPSTSNAYDVRFAVMVSESCE